MNSMLVFKEEMMLNPGRMIFVSLTIWIALTAVACGASSPTVIPTMENTPSPTVVPTFEVQQRPQLSAPAMAGDVDVKGHKLTYQCYGEGSPTIIVEAGAEDKPTLTLDWNAVIQGVFPTTRICIYDRVPANTSQDVAENLHTLLDKIHLPGPYILVAHSLGGWYARVFAHLYPQEVAGMILVDTTPTYPDVAITFATAYPTHAPDELAGITQNRMSEVDIRSIMVPPTTDGLDMETSNEQVRGAGSFGDIPLVVIGRVLGPENFPGVDPASQKQLAEVMLKVEADQAKLSSKGVFVVAATHDHYISLYQPQIIIDAIQQMVKEIRSR